jgi:RuvA, C-terminal domain
MAKVRKDAGSPLDDDAQLLLVSRHILGGPTDTGRANYQVMLTVCDQCGRGWQQGRGEQIEVSSDIVEMASCDAQQVGPIAVAPTVAAPPAPAHTKESRPRRARQTIPPSVRREVMRRDGGRCVVPGCRHGVFLDIHHVVLRSEGGDHDPDALIVLCSAHHRAQHRGQLLIDGRVSTGLLFRHADGVPYGTVVNPHTAAAQVEAFRALRALGFRESEVRHALERVRTNPHVGAASTEAVLRQALAVLTAGRHRVAPDPPLLT